MHYTVLKMKEMPMPFLLKRVLFEKELFTCNVSENFTDYFRQRKGKKSFSNVKFYLTWIEYPRRIFRFQFGINYRNVISLGLVEIWERNRR